MTWHDKAVLVTGAGGFIGSHLCEALLAQGAKVTAMIRYSSKSDWGQLEGIAPASRECLTVVAGNVEDSAFVDSVVGRQEVVFHLAALVAIPYSYVAPASYVRTNIEGTLNVLEACRRHGTGRVVHTSTSETYGTARYTPMDELHPLQAQSPYSASKIGADKVAESYHRSFALPVSTIRPFNAYGPRQSARAVIPTIISQALTQPRVSLGALDPIRDFTFVSDTVRGFLAVAESPDSIGATTNIGFGQGISVGALARSILSLLAVDKEIVTTTERSRPDQSEVYTLVCDNARARTTCGWSPQVSLEEGLRATIEFVRTHASQYKSDQYQR